jgi:pyruvate/2-oxoglutarate dehydrogenase complex dihydrolipoamide dehydrogenase (E3) component
MTQRVGDQAVVIGAGMAGLTAARALADSFDRVVVLERDTLPTQAKDRAGVPQGKHVHALLAGGERSANYFQASSGISPPSARFDCGRGSTSAWNARGMTRSPSVISASSAMRCLAPRSSSR